jgi:hypothetical protein
MIPAHAHVLSPQHFHPSLFKSKSTILARRPPVRTPDPPPRTLLQNTRVLREQSQVETLILAFKVAT